MWFLIQSSIIVGVIAHEYSYGWNTTGNPLVPGAIGAIIAFLVTLAVFHFRLWRARHGGTLPINYLP
jgi:hypothetical protein